MANRINVDITADDQADGELTARLVAAALNQNGFEDVTNISHPVAIERDEEVVAAMKNLSPGIFDSEVVIEVSTFAEAPVMAGEGEDDIPGDGIPEANGDDDDDVPGSDD